MNNAVIPTQNWDKRRYPVYKLTKLRQNWSTFACLCGSYIKLAWHNISILKVAANNYILKNTIYLVYNVTFSTVFNLDRSLALAQEHHNNRVLHRGLTSFIFLWFLRYGLLLKRALKSGGHPPEKFKMAAKFGALWGCQGGECLHALAGIKFLASASRHSPPDNYQSALRFFRRVSPLCYSVSQLLWHTDQGENNSLQKYSEHKLIHIGCANQVNQINVVFPLSKIMCWQIWQLDTPLTNTPRHAPLLTPRHAPRQAYRILVNYQY